MMSAKRQPNFTNDEIEAMVSGVEGKSKVLFGKFGGGGVVTSAAKEAAWAEICDNMRAVSGIQRSVTEVKKKWCGVKRFVVYRYF